MEDKVITNNLEKNIVDMNFSQIIRYFTHVQRIKQT